MKFIIIFQKISDMTYNISEETIYYLEVFNSIPIHYCSTEETIGHTKKVIIIKTENLHFHRLNLMTHRHLTSIKLYQ